jgi:hypothetical protein
LEQMSFRNERAIRPSGDTFGLIRDIDPSDRQSWAHRIFVTLDVDWAPDFVIREVSEMLTELRVPATWFITHESAAVEDLRDNDAFEIGVHPNFSPLLTGGRSSCTAREVIGEMRRIAPEARSFRCHSLVQSAPLAQMMCDAGFTVDCNVFLPFTPLDALAPWHLRSGLVKVPYCWEDDTWVNGECRPPTEVRPGSGLTVIDVHPIHLWLNSETLNRYERIKHDMSNEDLLRSSRNTDPLSGVQQDFRMMIREARKMDLHS